MIKNKDLSLGYCLNNPNKIILEKFKISLFQKMEVRNRKNQKSDKSDKKPSTEKETITLSNDYDWDFGSIAKNKLAKIQEIDPGKILRVGPSA